jgi:hypothetical protein
MRAYEIAAVVLGTFVWSVSAQTQESGRPADVTVYVTGAELLSRSEDREVRSTVSRMLAPAGVRIVWLEGEPKSEGAVSPVIHVRFVWKPLDTHSTRALAYTMPFAGGVKTITVLCERIRRFAVGSRREPPIMAHVLAHELGHVLQVTDRHTETGVMKAGWSERDFSIMMKTGLEFTVTDVELIRGGLKKLTARAGYLADGVHK